MTKVKLMEQKKLQQNYGTVVAWVTWPEFSKEESQYEFLVEISRNSVGQRFLRA